MNRVQEAVASVTGLSGVIADQDSRIEALESTADTLGNANVMLQRALEDLDYLNLYDFNSDVRTLIPAHTRATLNRLRRMRQENPFAKQAAKLTLRFTLGKGIEYTISPDPEQVKARLQQQKQAGTDAGNSNPNPSNPFQKSPTPPQPDEKGEAIPPTSRPPSDLQTDEPNDGEFELEDDPIVQIWEAFWNDPDNLLALTSHKAMKKWLDDVYTDGEKFFAAFTSNVEPYVKFTYVPMDEIVHIIYHPDNRAVPLYYIRHYQPTKWNGKHLEADGEPKEKYYLDYRITDKQLTDAKDRVVVPPEAQQDDSIRMFHSMASPIETKDGVRGISELYASREWFKVFKEFMEARAGINQAAMAIAWKRKVKGGAAQVAQFKGKLGDVATGYDAPGNTGNQLRKLTRPQTGSTYTANEAVDLEWMKTDTGAVNAEKDAKLLMVGFGAGTGTMMPYFGEGGDANLATAQTMELPMVKSYEDWQEFINEDLQDLARFVLTTALTDPVVVNKALKRVSFHFPPIITQDVVKNMTAWVQMVTSIAPGNEIVQREAIRGALTVMGVENLDHIMPMIIERQARANAEKEARNQMLMAQLSQANNGQGPQNSDGQKNAGNFPARPPFQAMPPDVKRVAGGNPPTQHAGPKPS